MAIRVAINGFGRIGRNVLRAIAESGRKDIEVVGINDLGPVETNAHLLRFDSVHGRFPAAVKVDGDALVVNGRKISNAAKQSVMPSFGTNQNVMCHLDDLYVYLRARADGALDRGRPAKKEPKNDAARAAESQCLGVKS